jgi:methylenetetrahydrofolate reductase (NADPH)
MSQRIIDAGIKFLHLYTLNLEAAVVGILEGLNILDKSKDLPWKKPSFEGRQDESVRPIFWSNKPKSYIARTAEWEDFPNGRWGVSRSPAFGEMDDYPSMSKQYGHNKEKKLKWWGDKIETLADVSTVFVNFLEGKSKRLPWSETSLAEETIEINEFLVNLNKNKFLTLTSQPCVNGLSSDDPVHGWGPKLGYVY